jgi:hypothetical protein
MEQAKRRTERVSGISNVTYDLLALLTNKLEGVAAIEEYKMDAQEAGDREVQTLLDQLQQQARQDVDKLRAALRSRLS